MNKRTEQTRWTPKRLLSLLMALIMTLSLLPTAVFAADGDTLVLSAAHWEENNKTQQLSSYTYSDSSNKDYRFSLGIGFNDFTPSTNLYPGAVVEIPFKCNFNGTLNPQKITFTFKDLNSPHSTSIEDSTITFSDGHTGTLSASVGGDGSLRFTVQSSYTLANDTSGSSDLVTVQIKDLVPASTWQVKFHMNDGTDAVYSSVPVQGGYGTTRPSDPTREGYKFAGWYTEADSGSPYNFGAPVTADTNVYAQWTKDGSTQAGSHKVTFLAGAADAYIPFPTPATVEDGAKYTIPTTPPTREGYTFAGWSDEQGNTYPAGGAISGVTKDIVLSAMWTATPVTVTFLRAGSLPDDVELKFHSSGESISSSVGGIVYFNVTVPDKYDAAKMVVTAGVGADDHQYLVPGLQQTDASGNVTFYYRFTVKEGMTYDDKVTGKTLSVRVSNVSEKTFTVMMPTGHFNAEITGATPAPPVPPATGVGSTVADDKKSASIVYGGGYTFTVTPKQGYDVEVYVNGAKKNAETDGSYLVKNVTGPQRVAVVESAIPNYTVTFTVPQSGEFFTQSVMSGGKATKPTVNPIREGYKFDGWYTADQYPDGTPFNFDTLINENTVLYGKLTPTTYTITYYGNGNDDGTVPAAQSKTHGLAVQLSTDVPTRVGHKFLGWGTTDKATAASYQPGDMYSVDGDITLYAVWEANTYTVSLPTGQGYSINAAQSTTVDYNGSFTFTVTVAREYAQKPPVVTITSGGGTLTPATYTTTLTPNLDQSVSYTYTISGITADQIVSVSVSQNLMFTVTFEAPAGTFYREQQVEQGSIATRPADPKVEGFTFGGWYKDPGCADADKWDFATPITGHTMLYAKLDPITPQITWPSTTEQVGYTMKVEYTKPGDTTAAELTTNPGTVPYKSVVTFTIKILDGYDASKMQVGINGVLLAPKDKSPDGKTYTYEFIATVDTKITVAGIERKTITITYNANATDDVEHIPGQQILKYYLPNAADNGTLDKATPKRVGYEFRGWSTDPETNPDAAGANLYQPGGAHNFVTDTNLYAIWKATSTTVTLEVSGLRKDSAGNEGQYEGKNITLTAEIKKTSLGTPGGSMRFYKKTIDGTTVLIETVPVTGEKVTLTTPVGEFFNTSNWSETYWVEYFPEEGKGFATSKSDEVAVRVWSAAISWSISGTKIASNGDVLKVYQNTKNNEANAPGDEIAGGTMIAGNVYWLEIPKVLALNGGNDPTIGHGYEILWQFMDDSGSWRDYTTTKDSDMVMIDADHSRYSFRANVVPTDPFTKAVDYKADGSLIDNQYNNAGLYTKQTKYVALQKTNTALEVTNAENELASVKINGATSFTKDHLAQFEGQAVTLTAKVTKDGGTDGVETGYVKFYRYVDGTNDTLLNTTLISVDANGIATLEVKVSAWDTAKDAAQNLDQFYAVYETNETYETSKSDSEAVYIKSAKLMTPIIESELEGTNGAKATTYSEDLNGLLAGVQHTFKLRQDADQTTKDYSVVALDGRTVDATNYDIEWQYKTDGNFAKAGNDSTAVTYTTTTTEVGDQYRVVLNAKGDMTVGATSKVAEIGTKQDVTVTVKAIDAITKTPETDVYQLNEITLTATVAAANDKPTMQPTGTVTFYYQDEADHNKWIELGTSTLTKNAQSTQGEMVATLQTAKLPVAKTTYTSLTSKITAVYSGDDTFQQNQTFTKGAASTENLVFGEIAKVGGNTTNDVEVTVRSSVVKGCADANKAVTTLSDTGIHISADGLAAHEGLVTLKLDEVYTLDAKEAYSKLLAGTDYTVQWQILSGASAHNNGGDYSSADAWVNIDGATDTTYTLTTVEQDAAYRAVITVANEPITKGSFTEIRQDATDALLNGHKQYYSNVLCAADGQTTIDVLIDTNGRGTNKEGITEGETVNVNVFLSGATQATPIADVTVKIENDTAKGNNETYSTTLTGSTVNGWNVFPWNTVGVAPGFYKVTVSSKSNTGYADETVTRSLIVRESSYSIAPSNTTVTYNGRTQGLTVTLDGFDFKGTGINEAANKSWTVRYEDANGNPVEPTQAGTYKAVITLPASAYWTEQTKTVDFTIEKRSVSIADAIAQAKVYDGTTDVSIVEVMLNDAVTDQTTNGTGLPTNNVGIINGDSIYAVATAAALNSANAGNNSFKISTIELRGDDANNYVWNEAPYTEDIYVSRSQVYGVSSTDVTLKAGEKLPADAVYMIDQAGNKITTYDVLYYLHTDTEIKKVDNTNEKGLYTVIVRPKQDNYKSGVTLRVTVGDATNYTAAVAPKPSTLIAISNTAELYGAATGVTASTTNSTATTTIEYQRGSTGWTATAPTDAGRYLVKVTASTGDVAYGIYTITKAHPSIDVTPATGLTYNSMPQNGYTTLTGVEGKDASKDYYITYAGDVAIGYNTPADGNVDEQAPVDAGTYTVTLHVNETENYTAHEISKSFTIAKKALTIKAKHVGAWQYGSMPGFYASYEGLAGDVNDSTPDTSLRDVQIAPELLFNPTSNNQSNYSNDALDQVGKIIIRPVDALSKNYELTPVDGEFTKNEEDPKPTLTILGLPQNGKSADVTVYYGDEIQLSAYGNYLARRNTSSFLKWEITNSTLTNGSVSIDENNILHVNGVGTFTVKLTRGTARQAITTEINVTAIQKEAKIALKNVDKVYTGALQTYAYEGNVTVHDELYQALPYFDATKVTRTNTDRIDVGTQITTAKVTGAWAYQSETYGGKFTINDKEASVAPGEQSTVYGTPETFDTNPKYTVTNEVNSVAAVSGVNVASQTDAYNRLDVHDGYEILVAGAENMNYNVKYTTDETAADSAVTTYGGETFTSKTTKELNDATVYGETPNVLDWTLVNVIGTTRDSVDYADNLADFDLPTTFVEQDKDDCTGNKVTYKAANRTTEISGSTVEYNQAALTGPRTSTDTATDENYTLKFNTVENSGKALLANNYKLTNVKTGNSATTTNALTANSKGFIPAAGESNDVSGENFVEGSANIAQRPIKLEKAVTDAQLYWRLPQSQLYTALVNILKAEENSVGRGLAKGHTIEDLDLSFTIKVGSTTYNVAKDGTDAINFAATGNATVTATVGDTNYKLEGGQYQFDIVLKNIQIEATYTTKTFTGFTVLIKVHNENGKITPLNDAKGLSYKIFKKTGNTIDKATAYASGTLTYQNRTAYDDKGVLCGVFTATYPQLPLLNSGETYFIQMYEYGVELKTNS